MNTVAGGKKKKKINMEAECIVTEELATDERLHWLTDGAAPRKPFQAV